MAIVYIVQLAAFRKPIAYVHMIYHSSHILHSQALCARIVSHKGGVGVAWRITHVLKHLLYIVMSDTRTHMHM